MNQKNPYKTLKNNSTSNSINKIKDIKGTSAEKLLISKRLLKCILQDIERMDNFNVDLKNKNCLPVYKVECVLNDLIRSLCGSLSSSLHAMCELEGCYNELNPKHIKTTRGKEEKDREEEKIDYNANYWDNVGKYEYYKCKYQ